MLRRAFPSLALLALTVIVALACFEIGFRLWSRYFPARAPRYDRTTVYYAPAFSRSPTEFTYSDGKPPNTFRIAAIGDSFTYPTLMQFDDAYPKRLERMLNLMPPEKRSLRAEVINFGQMGASSRSEIRLLERVLQYQPDLIVLEITLNDPESLPLATEKIRHPDRYQFGKLEITEENHPVLFRWKSLGYLAQRFHNQQTFRGIIEYYRDMYRPGSRWITFTSALTEMKRLADEQHVPVVGLVFPLFYTALDESYPFRDIHAQIGEFLSSIKVPSLDLFEKFEGMSPERLVVLPGQDSHPNEIAHRIAADALYQFLEDRQLLPADLRINDRFYRRGTGTTRIPAARDYPLASPEFPEHPPS